MMRKIIHPAMILALALLMIAGLGALVQAGGKYKGWERGGEYDKYYNAAEVEDVRVYVDEIIEVTPLPGMDPGVGLIVHELDDDEKFMVHVGPKGFVDLTKIRLRQGDKVKIRGMEAEIEGKPVFMASKIKKKNFGQVKVRLTSNGDSFWTMTPAELAKEMADN